VELAGSFQPDRCLQMVETPRAPLFSPGPLSGGFPGGAVTLLRPCATSAGFLSTRDPPWKMDMAGLKGRLAAAGYAVVVDAKVILIVRKAPPGGAPVESSLYDNGKVLLKTTDRPSAEAAYADLEPHLAAARRA
jgi:hypothetical protein